MHAVCEYPVKSTWLKAIAAGSFIGWPLLNVRNVKKYYPESTETPKGHRYSSEYGTNIAFHSSKREYNGNQELHPKRLDTH